jgi:hypothetical protein
MSRPGWLPPLAWRVYFLAVILFALVGVGGLVADEGGVALAAVGLGTALLYVGQRYVGSRSVFSDESIQTATTHRWGDVSGMSAFEPREVLPRDHAVYETRVDGQPVTARLVGGTGPETTRAGVTLVETPAEVARPGTGLTVESPQDEIPLSAATSRRVRELLRSTDGRLRFDDRVGVVRHESEGTLSDPDSLERAAKTTVAVARAVENSTAVDTAPDTNPQAELSLEKPGRE